jgi:hypothetical protein
MKGNRRPPTPRPPRQPKAPPPDASDAHDQFVERMKRFAKIKWPIAPDVDYSYDVGLPWGPGDHGVERHLCAVDTVFVVRAPGEPVCGLTFTADPAYMARKSSRTTRSQFSR